MTITVGIDPEFFLFDSKRKEHISAHDLVPGSKDKPHKLKDGAVQLDGTAVEFNINPASSAEEFKHNINSVLSEIRQMIPKRFEFSFKPSIRYSRRYWDTVVPDKSKELGCDPDFDAFGSNKPNERPNPGKAYETMRTGAGHIHLGWTKVEDPLDQVHFWDCQVLVRNLNRWYSAFKPLFDKDRDRQMLYGAGAVFRPKFYGAEYRTPSNAWLNYPNLYDWIFNSVQSVYKSLEDGKEDSIHFNSWIYPDTFTNRLGTLNVSAKKMKYPLYPDNWDKEVAVW